MSKALTYLASVRPAAATHLLAFYKESVHALDDKTRHLIQIVTKVVTGTERGLRQYAPKALKAGASKEEILDAVMMAFPAAGLPKVLSALEVLLEMDLLPPAPGQEAPPLEPPIPKSLGSIDMFPEKRMHCLHLEGRRLLVYRTGAESAKVYDGRCPHAQANLCKGIVDGSRLECRMHNWVFDLEDGHCLHPCEKTPLLEIPSYVQEGDLYCTLPRSE